VGSGINSDGSSGGRVDGGHPGRDATVDSTVVLDTGSLTSNDTGLPSSEGGGNYGVCVPKTCTELGANCGPMGDGCGGLIQCGNCTAPATCGGGGKLSNCGGNNNCTPKTCADWGATCGPVGDGCGGLVQCGSCTPPATCGGGGTPSVCGGNTGCVPKTCTSVGATCGPIGDGCGNVVQCGNCVAPQTCGGGGKPSVCGALDAGTPSDAGSTGDAAGKCVPATCTSLGISCGPAGDGCGGLLQCGTCTSPATCGGGIPDAGAGAGGPVPGVCGGGNECHPETCGSLGFNCGPAGDGCGGVLQCGTCAAPTTCGGGSPDAGGGKPGVCGGTNSCVKQTCADLGINCGPAGDGCGGLISSCGTCTSPEICGGAMPGTDAGKPGVCGPADAGATTCTGLCLKQVTCPGSGVTTAITGTVLAPNGADPIYNALVYVPNAAVAGFTPGVQCEQCTSSVSGSPLVSTTSAPDGTFELDNIPANVSFPLVIQLGRWRRQVTVPAISACTTINITTTPPAPASACSAATAASATSTTGCLTSLPTKHTQGDIPLTGFVSGSADPLECVLLKIGIAQSEFTVPTSGGRIQWYTDNGATISGAPAASTLYASQATINQYDMVVFSCVGAEVTKSTAQQDVVIDYANSGGRVFATHFSYVWLFDDAPFQGTASWNINQGDPAGGGNITGYIDFTNPKGQAFAQWLLAVGATNTWGQITLDNTRDDFYAVNSSEAQQWLYWDTGTTPATNPFHYTFNTPVASGSAACGRVLFSDFHVNNGAGSGTFPSECLVGGVLPAMTPQEHLLEFMLFDLASCVTPQTPPVSPTCTPTTCAAQGIQCGPAGDGCGDVLQCGPCTAPETCGGGGVPGVCGGTPCVPVSCSSQNIQCGPAGDGCGDLIQCGVCPNGETCGGGGQPGICGKPVCNATTCLSQGLQCGPTGDGCGGLLECGYCTTGQTCGGCGQTGQCVSSCGPDGGNPTGTCVPLNCKDQGISCGPAGDGCGNLIQCGPCPAGETCGGGGTPGVCGGSSCIPTTCTALGYNCGPTGDGCGGLLQCGTCPANETCGGGGKPGVCGSPCVPATCKSLGIGCGPAGDGCGDLLQCGTCVAPDTCGGGGVAGVCGQPNNK
jgi:hypothetical protein